MKPSHIAYNCTGSAEWSIKKKKKLYEGYRKSFENIIELMQLSVKKNIPVTTFCIMPIEPGKDDDYRILTDEISAFISDLDKNEAIHKNKIRVSVIGKWYALQQRLIEPIRKIIDDTKEYDSFFMNLCINYDGQEEIVDACKMIARRIKLGKIEPESVTKQTIKDDLYSSYFIPPDMIFAAGEKHSLSGFLLWDSVESRIVFIDKNFPDIKAKDIEKKLKKG